MGPRLVALGARRALAVVCALALLSSTLLLTFAVTAGARPSKVFARKAFSAMARGDAASAVPPSARAPAMPTARFTLGDELDRAIEVYPPIGAAPRAPLTVMLHATCMQPLPVCERFGQAGREGSFLVCPSGNDSCYGEPDWHGSPETKSAFLDRDLTRVEAQIGTLLDRDAGDVLVGWSRGAFAARDILYARVAAKAPPRFRAVVLIAAAVSPDPVRFRAAGVRRVVLAAGDQDGSRPTMQRAAVVLSAAGIEAHYTSLGPIGHYLPEDLDARLRTEMAWVRGGPGS